MVSHSASRVRTAAVRSSALSLAKSCSIGVQVGRVGRQIEHARAHRPDRLVDADDLVSRQVIQDDDILAAQAGSEHLLDIGPEHFARHRPVEHEGSDHAIPA